jgi:hypothetical protein
LTRKLLCTRKKPFGVSTASSYAQRLPYSIQELVPDEVNRDGTGGVGLDADDLMVGHEGRDPLGFAEPVFCGIG